MFARTASGVSARYFNYLSVGSDFARQVNQRLERLRPLDRPGGFFGYNTGCLETLELFNRWRLPALVDQIDAGRVHEKVVIAEERKWPGWQPSTGRAPEEYWRRLDAEWRAADRVVVNSPWSRKALVAQGVPAEKIVVLPLAYEAPRTPRPPRNTGELVVLYLGRVVLEKGIPYLFEAARLLTARPIRFFVAGPMGITPESVATAPPNIRFLGPITRDRVSDLYRAADLFVLPTLSDGFAITQLEAMAHGLPVITTPNCGEVVTDRVDGRIVPAGDAAALAAAIEEATTDRTWLREASLQAVETSRRFSLTRLAERFDALIRNVTQGLS